MNILIVSDCKEIGGTEIHIFQFIKLLIEDENYVEVISTSIFSSNFAKIGIKIHEIDYDDTLKAAKNIKALTTKNLFEIVIAFRWKAIIASGIAYRSHNIRKVASIHSEFVPGSRYDNKNMPDVERITQILNKYYNGIITASVAIKNSLLKYGVEENKTTVIKSFVNLPDGKIVRKVKCGGNIILGYFGRLSKEKGVDLLPEICSKLMINHIEKKWKLFVYGKGELEYSLKESIKNNNLEHVIELKGFTNRPYNEMNKIDILIVPSRQEGLGSVILEAMWLGIPVISFEVGGISELVVDGVNGYLIQQYNLDCFSDRIKFLIEHDKLRQEMSQKTIRLSKEMYDFAKLYNALKNYLLRIIGED